MVGVFAMIKKAERSFHNGARYWRLQRITAVLLIPFCIWFLAEVVFYTQSDYQAVLRWAAQPWIGAALALFVGLIFYHGALGLQVVIEDYVPNSLWQNILIMKIKIFSLIMAVLSWFFIIRIAIIANG
jgi:succinate dehydrogenase / fumarate reductase membrane anchor subunit